MAGWLECVKELGAWAEAQDQGGARDFHLPFKIEGDKIAGVSIKMQGNDKQWTTALKYALADLKWLLTWSTRHPPARTASGALWGEQQSLQRRQSERR
jgi:beclin 1